MLRKLFKYDFTGSCRWMWMMYAGLMLAACFSGFSTRLELSEAGDSSTAVMLMILSSLLLSLMVAAVFVLTIIQIVVRFYRNLMKSEGYLMHTLPVHTWQLITSKLLSALVLILFAFLACLAAGGIWMLCSGTQGVLGRMENTVGEIYNYYFAGVNGVTVLIESLAEGLLRAICLVLTCYACLALGQLANNHRILLAFLYFIGFRIISSILNSTVTMIAAAANHSSSLIAATMTGTGSVFKMIVQFIMSIACFIITEETLRRHLNLE